MIAEAARTFVGVDPIVSPIPVCPAVHYTMGGILCDVQCATPMPGLYAAGECSSVGIHGANRLGSNSLAEIVVFGKVAGESAAKFARTQPGRQSASLAAQAEAIATRLHSMRNAPKGEKLATLRDEMRDAMEAGVGIYREESTMKIACEKIADLRARYRHGVLLDDRNCAFNTEWLGAIELGFMLDVAQAMSHSAIARRESRGAHVRLDQYSERDDVNFLKHSLAYFEGEGVPRIEHAPVNITKSVPRTRTYGGAGNKAELT
jgi:fumarate reductase flavoprotein subunit